MAGYDDDLRFAHVLADAADDITMRRFRALDLQVETKPDLTPVTDADRAVEEQLRSVLRRARPRDAVLGEEFGTTGIGPAVLGGRPDRRHEELRPRRAGVGDADRADGRATSPWSAWCPRPRWAAAGGPRADGGAWTGRGLTKATRCRVSGVTQLEDASLLLLRACPAGRSAGGLDGFLGLSRSVWRTRAYGDFWSHMLVAEGAVDIAAEPEVSLWDMAALQVDRQRGGRPVHRPGGGPAVRRQRGVPPTGTCTTRF